ncbi:MFS transporter [Actinomadura mexicana]|uniref:Major Facilitator Superfamily protein n=1 Tax=Actinomadura mexicana TaxID=134959 RepID=A0A239FUJ3_9ACTN|nr:MFS transporter [Actinomadura mexicana]SNS60490.1 Major Facilitator Superfamily protein [Actinomadura mexicana]
MTDDSIRHARSSALGRRGWLVLLTLCGATFMTGLDYSVVTVALPEIGRDLGFASTGSLQWVATACLLPTASLLPLFGRVSDIVGRRRLFTLGVVLFGGLSLAAALATGPALLIAARAGQGASAAMITPTAIALLTAAFPDGPRRTRALGVNGAVLSLGFVLGTLGGGVITSGLNWRWTMLLLTAISVLVLLGTTTLPRDTGTRATARLDVPGAVLASIGLFALVYGISTGADAGWASPPTLGSFSLAALSLSAFLLVERRHPAPLIPLGLLNRPTVKWSGLVGFVTLGMCGGTTVLLSLYMQDVLGYSALATGAGFLAEGTAALIAGVLAARVIAVLGRTRTMSLGLAVQGVGTGAMVLLPVEGGLPLLLATSGAMGFGHVLTVVTFITTMTSGLRDDEQGIAGGLSQLPQFLGGVGTAGLAAIVTARVDALSSATDPVLATLDGLHTATLVAGLLCLTATALPLLLRAAPLDPATTASGSRTERASR